MLEIVGRSWRLIYRSESGQVPSQSLFHAVLVLVYRLGLHLNVTIPVDDWAVPVTVRGAAMDRSASTSPARVARHRTPGPRPSRIIRRLPAISPRRGPGEQATVPGALSGDGHTGQKVHTVERPSWPGLLGQEVQGTRSWDALMGRDCGMQSWEYCAQILSVKHGGEA
jgi:hypothetical protein